MMIPLRKLRESSEFKMIMKKVLLIKSYHLNSGTTKKKKKRKLKNKFFKEILSKDNNKIQLNLQEVT